MSHQKLSSQKYSDLAILLLRLAFGSSIIIGHGWKKMLKLFSGEPIQFLDPIGIGQSLSLALVVFAEVLCGVLIIIGLKTRLATIPLMIAMFVAIFFVQISSPFGKMELPLLFFVSFFCIFLLGGGKYSVDHILKKK